MSVVEGKIVFISGGARGIGLAITKELLKNGARGVSIIDINEDNGLVAIKEIEELFGRNRAIFIKTDVSDKVQLEQAFEKTVEIYKQLDIVVNNAGIVDEVGSRIVFEELFSKNFPAPDEVNWEKTLAVNLGAVIQGTLLAMQKYLPKYKSGDEGVIVNTSSIAAFRFPQSFPIYSCTKQGVVGLGRSLGGSEYYKKYKVRIVTMCPGAINTPLLQSFPAKAVPLSGAFEKRIEHKLNTAQEPEFVGKNFIEILKNAKNGSVWIVADGNPPFEVPVPEFKELHKQ